MRLKISPVEVISIENLKNCIVGWEELIPIEKDYWCGRKERDLEKEITTALELCNMHVTKLPDRTSGIVYPDLLIEFRDENGCNITVYIECKRRNKTLSDEQEISFTELTKFLDIYLVDGPLSFTVFLKDILSILTKS